MKYNCDICQCQFARKQNYERHLLTKKHKNWEQLKCNRSYMCLNCDKSFAFASGLSKHKEKCKFQKENDIQIIKRQLKEQEINFEKERKFMKEQIEKLVDKHIQVNTTHNTIETQHIDTQNNFTIHINAFGKENTGYLTEKTILKCIDRVHKAIPCIIEKIHFDPDHPENHNVKITNKKLPYASVMDENQKWRTVDRRDVIDTMVDNGYNLLDDTYKDSKEFLKNQTKTRFDTFQIRYESDDKDILRQIKSDVELLVLNGSNCIN